MVDKSNPNLMLIDIQDLIWLGCTNEISVASFLRLLTPIIASQRCS